MKVWGFKGASWLGLLSILVGFSFSAGAGTGFTYQGRLSTNGVPFDGTVEMQFTLWTEKYEGSMLATSAPPAEAVGVANGLFAVTLDFGAEPFDGQERWIEIAVRSDSGTFITLEPRQPISFAPHAIFATGVSAEGIKGAISATNLQGNYDQPVTFSNSANVFSGAFAGDGSRLTGLNAASLTGTAAISTTGNADGATNVYFGGSVMTSNLVIQTPSSITTNANAGIAHGGVQLSSTIYGQSPDGNSNYRNGIEFWPNGWDGTLKPTSDISPPDAFIRSYWNWGGGIGVQPTMHIGGRGNIRIEANFSSPYFGTTYIVLGNEDGNQKVRMNYVNYATTNGVDSRGYSLPLYFDARGVVEGNTRSAQPAIQGWFAGTNGGADAFEGLYPGELAFLARGPLPDLNHPTFGVSFPSVSIEVGRMLTNGWKFYGKLIQEQSVPSVETSTNIVLDFNSASAQTINLAFASTTRFYTTNVNAYGGMTNFEPRTFRIRSGAFDRPLSWPNWTVVSESGLEQMPSLLPAGRILYLKLDAWGSGETNIVARFATGTDASFSYDQDASAYLALAGISNSTQSGAVDYLVKTLKAENLWTNFVALYPLVGGTSKAHSLNLKDVSRYQIVFAAAGVTHGVNGITGDGSTGYGDTGIQFHSALGYGGMTNCHLSVYCRTEIPNDNGHFIGVTDGAGRMGLSRLGLSLGADGPMNGNGPNPADDLGGDFHGFMALTRANAANEYFTATRLGVVAHSGAEAGMPTNTVHLLSRSHNGTIISFSTANLAFASVGWGLTPAQLTRLEAIVNNFETMLGRL